MGTVCKIGFLNVDVICSGGLPPQLGGLMRAPSAPGVRPGLRLHIETVAEDGREPAPRVGRNCCLIERIGHRVLLDAASGGIVFTLELPLSSNKLYWFWRDLFGLLACMSADPMLHSSAVICKNMAYVFCGRSRSGKSTVAALLSEKYRVINDEINWLGLRADKGVEVVNQRYWMNRDSRPSLPLGGLYLLEKAPACRVGEVLGVEDAFLRLVSTYLGTEQIPELLRSRSRILSRFLQQVPVRPLYFNLNAGDVETVLLGQPQPVR